jgi:hypothetical protein
MLAALRTRVEEGAIVVLDDDLVMHFIKQLAAGNVIRCVTAEISLYRISDPDFGEEKAPTLQLGLVLSVGECFSRTFLAICRITLSGQGYRLHTESLALTLLS